MELKVLIDKPTIDVNVETAISAENILIKGNPVGLIHEGMFTGFLKKIIPIVKDRRNVEMKQTVSKSGENIIWVQILSNSSTSQVFEIFKSMGIYMPKLVVGINSVSNTVYTSSKLCRDLNKYSDIQKAAVLMYILTLTHFVIKSEDLCLDYEYDGLTNALKVIGEPAQFAECLRKFTNDETWYVKDFNDDNYETVKFFNNSYVSVNDQYANGSAVKLGVLKNSKGFVGVACLKIGAFASTFVSAGNVVFTDFDMCNMELASDTVCSFIANAFGTSVTFKKSAKLPLSSDMSFVDCDADELSEIIKTDKFPKWLSGWLLQTISKGATIGDSEDFEYLCKAFGVKAPVGSGTATSLTCEEMRKLYDTDEYAQHLYKQIQPYYEKYVLGTELDANIKGFSNGAIYSMAFVGESGTGKSTAARVIPARCGIPYISVNFSVNIEEADLFGSMVPNAKKSKPEDPEFVWADGIITKAVRYGYCVILEELNFARPGVLGKLNSLLDENRQIDLSTGEIVKAHPNFRIIATCNIAYEGTNRFNKALINRFDDVTVFKDLPRNEAITVIKNRTGYSSTVKISKVYDVYEALKKFAAEQNVNAVVSMRQLLNVFTKGKYYSNAKDAVQRIIINGAFIEDSEYQKVFEDTVFSAFDLKFKI